MSGLATSVGLISGINIAQVVDSLIALQRAPAVRLEQRVAAFQSTETGLSTLEANLLTLVTSAQQLGNKSNFKSLKTNNSDKSQIRLTTKDNAVLGTYHFQAIRRATTHELISKGFANSDQQSVGSGTLRIADGGRLEQPTPLSVLNDGNGVRRGVVRLTDRSGQTADIDLSNAFTVDDVLAAINDNNGVSVVADTGGGSIVLTDTSGGTASDLAVVDLNGGHAAADLGIGQSVAASVLTGDSIYGVTVDFALAQINDGNGLRLLELVGDADVDLKITLTDDSVIGVDLDGSASLKNVIDKINNHQDNAGKLAVALVDGRLEFTDLSGGGGTSAFTIENSGDNSDVVRQLGLDVAAAGNQIVGNRLMAGLNSVLLRNLRGGTGIDQTGQITLTDRTGVSATLDLTGVESLDEVLNAVNAAESSGGTKLQLTARINDTGTGIEVRDTSGSTAGNLTIADVGGSTLATQLGIAVDAAQDAVDSGSLNFRYVNEATSVEDYAPDGGGIGDGSFLIVDSAGNEASISIGNAVTNIGDVLQRINAAAGVNVRAELNETGDGFVLIDEAGGTGTLHVEEVGSTTTAADLRIVGDGVLGADGKYRIESRRATIVEIAAGDTLQDLVQKINDAGPLANAAIIDDGSAFNSKRLSLTATASGNAGRLIIDAGGLDLGLSTRVDPVDALLRIGGDVSTGFLVSSGSNSFKEAVTGLDVDIIEVGNSVAQVTVSRDAGSVEKTLDEFVASYNALIAAAADLTKFDLESETRGALQGEGIVLRMLSRLDSLVNRRLTDADGPIQSLLDVGIRVGKDGKLEFNKTRLNEVLEEDPQAVADFFLARSGELERSTLLDSLSTETEIRRGVIRVTDRSGQTADIDLSNALTVGNVIDAINASGVSVFASLENGTIKIEDTSGATDSDLIVADVLTFDDSRLAETLGIAQSVASSTLTGENVLFLDGGFANHLENTIDSFTDPFTGTFTLEKNSLQESVDSLTQRIEQLDAMLLVRRDRLTRQFNNMETALAALTSQQQALQSISQLRVNRVGTGISSA